MRDLTLFTLGKNKYGIWQDQAPTVKEIEAIHWLPPVPQHIAGLSILDGQTVTLFDFPACIGLSPISKERQSYPALLLEHEEKIAGFIVDVVMGHFAIQSDAVYPMPDFLQTPLIDCCAMYDSEPIPIINISGLFKSVQNVDFEPCVAECRIRGARPQKTSPIKTVRVFESGGETFAIPASGIEKAAVKPGRVSRPPLLPRYVRGITFHDENLVSLIHMSRCMRLAEEGAPMVMLVADVMDQNFGLLVDADRGQWSVKDLTFKPLPPLAQSDWMREALVHATEIIPILEPGELISNQTDGLVGTPLPQRYTPSSHYKSIFRKQDVKVCEFSLLGVRHAVPDFEVEDQIRIKAYRPLPKGMSIVAGVVQHAGDLLPVLDLAACFGRSSPITPDWQMLLVSNGDFRALVVTEAIYGERLLPLSMHRELPFDEPHSLVYGCYPDEATVRLVLNVQALAVHFDKTLFKEFFTSLSKEIALGLMDIGLESEPEKAEIRELSGEEEEPAGSSEPEEVEKSIALEGSTDIAAALAASKDDQKIEIQEIGETTLPNIDVSVMEKEEILELKDEVRIPDAQEIVAAELEACQTGPAKFIEPREVVEGKEKEEGSGPEKPAAMEGLFRNGSEESTVVMTFTTTEDAEEKREITATADIVPLGTITEATDPEEISTIEEKTAVQAPQENAASLEKETQVGIAQDNEGEPELDKAELSVSLKKSEDPTELQDSIDPELEVFQTRISEKNTLQAALEKEEKKEHEGEIAELLDFIESEEPIEVENAPERTAHIATEGNVPPINETADADEKYQSWIAENIGPQTAPEKNEQKEQEEEIFELQDYMESEERIEVEDAPERTEFVSTEVTALSTAEAANDYCESDTRKRPKIKYALAVCAAILLIGLLMVTLYPSGLLNNGMVNKEKGKLKAPIVVAKPMPLQVERKKVPQSEKRPTISPGPKIVEVKNERTELAATLEKPQASAKKNNLVQRRDTAPVRPLNTEVFETHEEKLATHPAVKEPKPTPAKTQKQQPPGMVSPESTDTAIHNVKRGDTLWDISKRYTGTGFNYNRVAKENEISNPDLIFPKQKLRVSRK